MTKEMFEKAKTAKSAEELIEMAKAENIKLSQEQAKDIFARLNSDGELSDEELDAVSGGCGDDDKDVKRCPNCGTEMEYYAPTNSYRCNNCHHNSKTDKLFLRQPNQP